MAEVIGFLEFLEQFGGAEVVFTRTDDPTLAAALLSFPEKPRLLVLERTYREGIRVVVDPTPEEIETARLGSLWELWNSDRSQYLAALTHDPRFERVGLFEAD